MLSIESGARMQKCLLIRVFVALCAISAGLLLGHKWHEYQTSPERLHKGLWEGSGVLTIDGKNVHTNVILIIDPKESRVSINHQHDTSNYTYDAKLQLRYRTGLTNHLEIFDRELNGINEFMEATSINIPNHGSLLSLQIWRLEADSLFLSLTLPESRRANYILKKQ